MAAPVYATNMTLLTASETSTGFTAVGGGGSLVSGETDFFVEQNACLSKNTAATWDSSGTPRGGALYNNGSGVTIPTNGAFIAWVYWWAPGVLDTLANGGMELNVGNSTTAYYGFYIGGSDEPELGGWFPAVCDPNETAQRSRTQGSPSGTWQYFGWQAYVLAAASVGKGAPWGVDVMRYGRCDLICTNGDVTNGYASFGGSAPDGGAAAYDNANARRWGLLTPERGAYYQQGLFQMGTSGTAVDFRDSNRTIFIRNTRRVSAGFNAFDIQNASSRVDWTNISISALGTQSRGTFTVTDNADVNFDSCTFTDMNTFGFLANSAVIDSTFRRCNEITAPGSVFTGTLIATPTVAADSYALRWNPSTAQDTNGYLDNMAFTKGTNAHHAIRFSTYKASHDLIGISFSGFNASNAQNDSTLYFDDTGSDVTWTINLIGCSGNISYKKARAGDTVTLVSDPVALAVHVQDSITGTAISGARVWAAVTSTAGGRYYNTSVSSITQTGGTATATVADTSSLVTGNYVWIQGAGVEAYNGTKQITVTGGTTFTFAIDSGTASPAGGTITATFVVINGTTDGSGNISGTFSWSASQPITGRVRDADGTPFYYKTGPFSGTIDSANGLAVTVQMIRDE